MDVFNSFSRKKILVIELKKKMGALPHPILKK